MLAMPLEAMPEWSLAMIFIFLPSNPPEALISSTASSTPLNMAKPEGAEPKVKLEEGVQLICDQMRELIRNGK